MCDYSPNWSQPKIFIFYISFRPAKYDKNTQKSIIEIQSTVDFLITDIFLQF